MGIALAAASLALVALPLIAKVRVKPRLDETGCLLMLLAPIGGIAAFLIVWLGGVPVAFAATSAGIGLVVTVALIYFCEHEFMGLATWERLPQPLTADMIALGWPVATPLMLGLWIGSSY